MLEIQQITDQPKQSMNLILPDGTLISLSIRFVPMQAGWFIDEIAHLDFTLTNVRIVNSPNMLRQWKNMVPFGLACFTTNNREPGLQQDFSSGASKLYILTEAEVEQFEDIIEGG